MKKQILASMLIVCMGTLLLVGCSKKSVTTLLQKDVTVNTTLLMKDGKLQSAVVESFEEDYYKEDELKTFINDTITDYSKKAGEDAVKLESLKVEDKLATAKFSYNSVDTYQEFNDIETVLLSKEQAQNDTRIPETLLTKEEAKEVAKQEAISTGEFQVFIMNNPGETMIVNGEVLYYANATLIDDNTVQAGTDGYAVVIFK